MQKKVSSRVVVQCALFLAIGLVIRNFSYMVSMGGGTGMRIGFSGVFIKLPAVIFGPLFGALTCGLYDCLGAIIKPEGAYIFPLTLTAAAGGALYGLVYRLLKSKDYQGIKKIYFSVVALSGVAGVFNHLCTLIFPSSFWGSWLLSLGKKTGFFIYGFYALCIAGILFYIINAIIEKKSKADFFDSYLKIFLTLLICDIPVTTANTFILIKFIPVLGKLGFFAYYLPRLIEEIFMVFVTSYFMTYFYKIYKRIFG